MTKEKTATVSKEQIQRIIGQHESMKNSYFWNSPAGASSRRDYEKQHSLKIVGIYNEIEIDFECKVECSCKNIYYCGSFYINGKKCTIRSVKSLIK